MPDAAVPRITRGKHDVFSRSHSGTMTSFKTVAVAAELTCASEGHCETHPDVLRPHVSIKPFTLVSTMASWMHGYARPGNHKSQARGTGFTIIVEREPAILLQIAAFMVSTPKDYAQIAALRSTDLAKPSSQWADGIWRRLYARRWPAFYDCVLRRGVSDWRLEFRRTRDGQVECLLEVFDREKQPGYNMSAMPAWVSYEPTKLAYVAAYLSACEVAPEKISLREESRLRFCPASVRESLRPEVAPPKACGRLVPRPNAYPYRVLCGLDKFALGQVVELQWTMQYRSAFAWWCCVLESIRYDEQRNTATATITFPQFRERCRWYRMLVTFGDGQMRECEFGGYTGGLRVANCLEVKQWKRFFRGPAEDAR